MSAVVDPHLPFTTSGIARPAELLPISRVDFGEFSRDLLRGIRWLHCQHGPIAAIDDAGQRVVFLFSPEYNQQVLSDADRFQAHFFAIRGPKNSAQRRVTCGLLSMNGEQHRRNRRIVKEPFALRSISTYGETIIRLTDEMLDGWKPGDQRDMAEEMRQFMLRVTSTILFGMDDPAAAYRLGDMIAEWVGLNHDAGVGALVPNERFSHLYEKLLTFAAELETEIRAMIHKRRNDSRPGSDVLSILVRTHDEQGGLSDEELVGQAAVLFGAAHMTTAHSLTWTLFLLAQHPGVMRELSRELQLENKSSPVENKFPANGRPPKSFGSLPKGDDLSLLDRIIKESMRLLPASAYSQRVANDGVQLGPFFLTRGTGIVFSPLVTHHLADLYPEPEKFQPDRWITLRPSPYAYHPFGAGPRLCIGAPLATAIIRLSLQRILSRFKLTVAPGSDIGVHVESTMLVPTNGLPMIISAPDGQYNAVPVTGNIHELVDLESEPENAAAVPRRPK